MKVLVTRPAAQAAEWVVGLCERGIDAAALPLIGIHPPADAAPVRAAWAALAGHRMAMFVSPNAAEQFFALRPAGQAWPEGTTAGSPGPGTSRVLRSLGVPAACIAEPAADAAQFDSESLWQQLRTLDWHGASVLIVRGESGRDWLADTLRAHGAQVSFVTAYERCAPTLDDRNPSATWRPWRRTPTGARPSRWPPTRASPSAPARPASARCTNAVLRWRRWWPAYNRSRPDSAPAPDLP
jgi:uroporphyrinogen-III synthase